MKESQEQEVNLDDFSIETPTTPEFLPYDQDSAAVSFNDHQSDDDDDYVRHGRSPRFWMAIVGLFVLVAVAAGAGVGVAMSGGGGDQSISAASAAGDGGSDDSSYNRPTGSSNNNNNKGDKQSSDTRGDAVDVSGSMPANGDSEVFDILLSHSRFHGKEFQDPNSYQSRAAQWVETTADINVHTPQRLVQRYALACIYYATNGVRSPYTDEVFGEGNPIRGWIDETGWLVADDECEWYQITCDDNGAVVKIELYGNRLTGAFPPEVALLKQTLQVIDLYRNNVYNSEDEGNKWLGELTNLRKLFYGNTYFQSYGIPTEIGLLTNLEEYDCSYSLYHGPLKGESFARLSNLAYLNMGGNSYNTTIPIELATLPQLQYMYAEYTDLTGDLSFILNMTAIVELWVDKNPQLEGGIPSGISTVSTLKSFSVTHCDLDGTVPAELGDLGLTQMWLYGNDFTGDVPQEICSDRYPNGRLMTLEADCNDIFSCSCCTCCGAECFNNK